VNLHVVLLQFIAAGELMSQVRICKKKSCVAVRIFAFCGVSQCEFYVLQCVAVRSCVLLFYNVLQWGAHFASKNLKEVLRCIVLQANRGVLHCAAPRILVFLYCRVLQMSVLQMISGEFVLMT